MRVYRLTAPEYADKLDGKGAAKYGGRWNSKGTYVLYTCTEQSLTFLEKLVHLNIREFPDDLILTELELNTIPHNPELPSNWDKIIPPFSVPLWGDQQIKDHIALQLPSVIFPSVMNVLISTRHPEFTNKLLTTVRSIPFKVDRRLQSALQD